MHAQTIRFEGASVPLKAPQHHFYVLLIIMHVQLAGMRDNKLGKTRDGFLSSRLCRPGDFHFVRGAHKAKGKLEK